MPYEERVVDSGETHGEFTLTLPAYDVHNGFWYKFQGGDAETPEFQVRVRSAPLVTDFDVTYHFRPYLRRADQTSRDPNLEAVERTEVTSRDLLQRFGRDVAELVGAVTEDPRLGSYRERKSALRRRATGSGEEAAILFAADKVSKVRQYRAQVAQAGEVEELPRPRRLHHYRQSLRRLERTIPGYPLVVRLEADLAGLGPVRAAATTAAVAG